MGALYYRIAAIRFECSGCGKCCFGDEDSYVEVAVDEAEAIRKHLDVSPAWFRRRYLIDVPEIGLGIRLNPDGRCPFLGRDLKCRVYPVRPSQCSTYPFWSEVVGTRGAWKREGQRCEGIDRGPSIAVEFIESRLRQQK